MMDYDFKDTSEKMHKLYPAMGRRKSFSVPPMKNTLFIAAMSGEGTDEDSINYSLFTMDDVDALARLVVAYIDPQSDCAGEKDIPYRKKLAFEAVISVVKVGNRALKEYNTEGILFNMMVSDFLSIINSILYESWFSINIQFHKLNEALRAGNNDGKDIKVLMASLETVEKELMKRTNSLFPTERMATAIAELETAKTLGGWAEEYAQDQPWLSKDNG